MPEVNAPYAPGTPCWVDLMAQDQQGALEFYKQLFGWQGEPGASETGGYAVCTLDGRPVAGIGPAMDPGTPTVWTTYLASDDARATADRIGEAGGEVMSPVMDVMSLGSMLVATDPTGAVFGVWEHKEFIGAQVVNQPGALVWNECNTRDVAADTKFYGSVFGATFEPVEGAENYHQFQVNGKTVGGLQQMTDPPFPLGIPSHWHAYFSVADTDATVDTAVRRGAEIVAAAEDTPYGRIASLRDPWGAAFALIAGSGSS